MFDGSEPQSAQVHAVAEPNPIMPPLIRGSRRTSGYAQLLPSRAGHAAVTVARVWDYGYSVIFRAVWRRDSDVLSGPLFKQAHLHGT
jgi:hypothetical protein